MTHTHTNATRLSICALCLFLVPGFVPRVWAGGIITFDPMTYIEDLSSALSGVQQEANTVESDLYEGEMLRYQIAQLKNLNPDAVSGMLGNGGLGQQVQAYQNMLYGLDNVYGSVHQLRSMINGQNQMIESTGLGSGTRNWSAHLAAAVKMGQKQGTSTVGAMKASYAALQTAQSNIRALKQDEQQVSVANPTTRGQMTVMNAQLSLVARQNQSLIGVLGPDIVAQENHLNSQAAERVYKNQARLLAAKKQQQENANFKKNTAASGQALICAGIQAIDKNPVARKEAGHVKTGCRP